MSLSTLDIIGMLIRRSPVSLIRRSLERLNAAGLEVPTISLEVHAMAGGDLDRTVDAYIMAHKAGSPARWEQLVALDLAGHNPVAAVDASLKDRELDFVNYSPGNPELILGHTRDGALVRAACRVQYRPPLLPAKDVLIRLQERVATRMAIAIDTAESRRALSVRSRDIDAQLLALAREVLPSTRSVHATFKQHNHI